MQANSIDGVTISGAPFTGVGTNTKVTSALSFAHEAHLGQLYGSGPKTQYEHVEDVVKEVRMRSNDPDVIAAAALHDVVEDTSVTRRMIALTFGDTVADLVWRVSDEPGPNRKMRKARTYWKIRESEKALLIKLADRLVNVRASSDADTKFLRMYADEHPSFFGALWYPDNPYQELWDDIARLLKFPVEGTRGT